MIYYSLPLPFLPHAPAQQQPGPQGRPRPCRARLVLPDFRGHWEMMKDSRRWVQTNRVSPWASFCTFRCPSAIKATPRHRNGEGSQSEGPQLLPFPICSWRAQDELR